MLYNESTFHSKYNQIVSIHGAHSIFDIKVKPAMSGSSKIWRSYRRAQSCWLLYFTVWFLNDREAISLEKYAIVRILVSYQGLQMSTIGLIDDWPKFYQQLGYINKSGEFLFLWSLWPYQCEHCYCYNTCLLW